MLSFAMLSERSLELFERPLFIYHLEIYAEKKKKK